MKLQKSLAVVLTSAALFSLCTGTMVEASKRGEYKSKEQQEQDYAVKEYKFLEELITKNLNEIKRVNTIVFILLINYTNWTKIWQFIKRTV